MRAGVRSASRRTLVGAALAIALAAASYWILAAVVACIAVGELAWRVLDKPWSTRLTPFENAYDNQVYVSSFFVLAVALAAGAWGAILLGEGKARGAALLLCTALSLRGWQLMRRYIVALRAKAALTIARVEVDFSIRDEKGRVLLLDAAERELERAGTRLEKGMLISLHGRDTGDEDEGWLQAEGSVEYSAGWSCWCVKLLSYPHSVQL